MPVHITEERRGPALLLFLSCFGDDEGEHKSGEYVIDNFAAVKIGLRYDDETTTCYFQCIKLDVEKDITVKMNASCESFEPIFSCEKEQICSLEWSEEDIFKIPDFRGYGTDENVFDLKFNFRVKQTEKPTLCTKMYLDADFTDFCLSAVNGIVTVHKIVLASHSDVFKAMLNGEWKETVEGQITMKGITRESLQHLKDYMYLDILPEEGLCPLLLIAVRYLIEDLKTRCIAKLVDTLTAENLYSLLDFACQNNIPELTYEILHLTPSKIVDAAYQKSKKNKCILPKSADKN